MNTPFQINSKFTPGKPEKPVRDKAYLAFIRRLPCSVCSITRNIEAAHQGKHGVGQKASDLSAIPLCIWHHRRRSDSYHAMGPQAFAECHGIDVPALIEKLNRFYAEKIKRRAA